MIVRNTINQIQTENNIEVSNLFTIPIINIIVEEDTSELTSNTEFLSSKLQNPFYEFFVYVFALAMQDLVK